MSKRFTDSEKWKKRFIRNLSPRLKLFWLYLLDDCDHAGIWHVDPEVAAIRLGVEVDMDVAIEAFGDRITVFDDGNKWFIPDFIEFQYGKLSETNRMHKSVISILTQQGVSMPLGCPLEGAKDKDKDKGKDKNKEKEEGDDLQDQFGEVWKFYPVKQGKSKAFVAYKKAIKSGVTDNDIVVAIERYKEHVALKRKSQPELNYRNGDTWFHNNGWEDEYTVAPTAASGRDPSKQLHNIIAAMDAPQEDTSVAYVAPGVTVRASEVQQ